MGDWSEGGNCKDCKMVICDDCGGCACDDDDCVCDEAGIAADFGEFDTVTSEEESSEEDE